MPLQAISQDKVNIQVEIPDVDIEYGSIVEVLGYVIAHQDDGTSREELENVIKSLELALRKQTLGLQDLFNSLLPLVDAVYKLAGSGQTVSRGGLGLGYEVLRGIIDLIDLVREFEVDSPELLTQFENFKRLVAGVAAVHCTPMVRQELKMAYQHDSSSAPSARFLTEFNSFVRDRDGFSELILTNMFDPSITDGTFSGSTVLRDILAAIYEREGRVGGLSSEESV